MASHSYTCECGATLIAPTQERLLQLIDRHTCPESENVRQVADEFDKED